MFTDRQYFRPGRWVGTPAVSADTTPPTISTGPTVSAISNTSATVAWTLNEAGTGVVGYGLEEPGTAASVTIVDTLSLTGSTTHVRVPSSSVSYATGDMVVIVMGKTRASELFYQANETSGWTFAFNAINTTDNDDTLGVAYKVITGSEPTNWEFQRGSESSSTAYWSAVVIVLRNADSTLDATATLVQGTNSFNPDAPDITTVAANALVLTGHHSSTRYLDYSATATAVAPTGYTLIPKAATTGTWTTVAYREEATPGAKVIGGWDHTPNEGSSDYQVWTLSIAPTGAPAPAGTTRASDYSSQSGFEGSLLTSHSRPLTALAADTTYHYVVESADAAGNVVTSADGTFATTAGGGGDAGGFPTSQTGLTYVAWGGSLTEPDYLAEVADTNFEGSITRITPDGATWRAQYPRKPVWNADQSRMILLRGDSERVLDGTTYDDLGEYSSMKSRTTWSATDPNLAWQTSSGDNRYYSINPGVSGPVSVHQFSDYDSVNNSGEGRQSNDDRYHVLGAMNGSDLTLLFYDAQADSIVGTLALGTTDVDSWGTSPSGMYGWVRFANGGYGWGQGIWAFDQAGQPLHGTAMFSGSHNDCATDENGHDVHVALSGGKYVSVRYDDNSRITLLDEPAIAGHMSGVAFQRPGWIYIGNSSIGALGTPGYDQLWATKLDGSYETQVWCHARTLQTRDQYLYDLSTHMVPSPDGKRITWGGAWERWTTDNDSPSGYVVRVAP